MKKICNYVYLMLYSRSKELNILGFVCKNGTLIIHIYLYGVKEMLGN